MHFEIQSIILTAEFVPPLCWGHTWPRIENHSTACPPPPPSPVSVSACVSCFRRLSATNVYPSARRRKLAPFRGLPLPPPYRGMGRIAVAVSPATDFHKTAVVFLPDMKTLAEWRCADGAAAEGAHAPPFPRLIMDPSVHRRRQFEETGQRVPDHAAMVRPRGGGGVDRFRHRGPCVGRVGADRVFAG